MFCLRSWLPLLFIPTNASPAFIFLFFVCTYFLHRPCVYCSVLLLILFLTSCNWSDRCFFDYHSNWFLPRPITTTTTTTTTAAAAHHQDDPFSSSTRPHASSSAAAFNQTAIQMLNSTAKAVVSAALEKSEWTGLGLGWLRNLLGKREWQIQSMDIYIRL